MSGGSDIQHNHSAGSWMCPACERNDAMAEPTAEEYWKLAQNYDSLCHKVVELQERLAAAEKREAKLRAKNERLRRVAELAERYIETGNVTAGLDLHNALVDLLAAGEGPMP